MVNLINKCYNPTTTLHMHGASHMIPYVLKAWGGTIIMYIIMYEYTFSHRLQNTHESHKHQFHALPHTCFPVLPVCESRLICSEQ